jgi:hypothetical protein
MHQPPKSSATLKRSLADPRRCAGAVALERLVLQLREFRFRRQCHGREWSSRNLDSVLFMPHRLFAPQTLKLETKLPTFRTSSAIRLPSDISPHQCADGFPLRERRRCSSSARSVSKAPAFTFQCRTLPTLI